MDIFRIGDRDTLSRVEKDILYLTNTTSFATGGLTLLTLPFVSIVAFEPLGTALLPFVLIYFLIPVLNYYGLNRVTPVIFTASFLVGLFIYTRLLGNGFGLEILYFPAIVFSFLFFTDYFVRISFAFASIVLLMIVELNLWNPFDIIVFEPEELEFLRSFIKPGSVFTAVCLSIFGILRIEKRRGGIVSNMYSAIHDAETGLLNRMAFFNRLELLRNSDRMVVTVILIRVGIKDIHQIGKRQADNIVNNKYTSEAGKPAVKDKLKTDDSENFNANKTCKFSYKEFSHYLVMTLDDIYQGGSIFKINKTTYAFIAESSRFKQSLLESINMATQSYYGQGVCLCFGYANENEVANSIGQYELAKLRIKPCNYEHV